MNARPDPDGSWLLAPGSCCGAWRCSWRWRHGCSCGGGGLPGLPEHVEGLRWRRQAQLEPESNTSSGRSLGMTQEKPVRVLDMPSQLR